MGSCFSSAANGKSGNKRDDQVTDASTAITCASPKKQKQRQKSNFFQSLKFFLLNR